MSGANGSGFLGSGWVFPARAGDTAFSVTDDETEAIRQSIGLILGTSPGERMMRPDFGCGIHDLVFGVNDAATASAVSRSVSEALAVWEPRIDVLDVYAAPDADEPRRLVIEINYRVRSTNSRFNLVYPFYLG